MTGQAKLMQRPVKQDAGKISRKRSARAVCTMHPWRQTDDQ